MKKIILKKYPDKNNFFETISIYFHKIFKAREFFLNKNGRFVHYKFSSPLQVFLFVSFIFIIFWTTFTTKIFFKNLKVISEDNNKVELAKLQFDKALADIKVYRDSIAELNKKLETSHNNIVSLLSKDNKLSTPEREKLLKQRMLLSSELKYVNSSLDRFIFNTKWDDDLQKNNLYKNSKAELERDMVLNENVYLKKKNNNLEKSLHDMTKLQNNLLDKISFFSNTKIKTVEGILKQIDSVLSGLDLKDRKKIVNAVQKEFKGSGVGGPSIPINIPNLSDKKLNEKFKDTNLKVDTWTSLETATKMLPFGNPLKVSRPYITSPYGVRKNPIASESTDSPYEFHSGVDFNGAENTPLYSTSAGKIIKIINDNRKTGYGNHVIVDHGIGFSTLYAHLNKVNDKLKIGSRVEKDDLLGYSGSTGRSTGPHIHYEIRYKGKTINPYSFVFIKQ